ncbi:MAG TPA: hypothetical protein VGL81_22475 [Polyangiaceae bacterium]|jgi:hypothetical protein|nr:hypothetical protein [Polyangiaceae bacterium]
MASLDAAIERYIATDIALSAKDISACAASREWFLTRLQNEIASDEDGPQLLAGEPFVNFGSYFKGTKVRDVDEFDVLVVVDSNTGVFSSSGEVVGHGEGDAAPNHKYDARFKKGDGSGVSPAKVLGWLRGVAADVAESYGGEAPVRDGQAIIVRIASKDLAIDLVPAGVFTRARDGSTFYNIAKGDAGDEWTLTSPRVDIEQLEEVAEGKANFRNVVRIIKRVKDVYGVAVSSFALETSVVAYARATNWTDFVGLELRWAMRSVANAIEGGCIADPYDPSANLIADAKDRARSARVYRLVADRLEALGKGEAAQTPEDLYDHVHKLFEG